MRVLMLSLGVLVALSVVGTTGVVHAAAPAKKKGGKQEMGTITWKVGPDDVMIYLDGKKVGTAAKAKPQKVKPGTHLVKVTFNKDEVEEPISVAAGATMEFQYTFEDSGAPKSAEPPPEEPAKPAKPGKPAPEPKEDKPEKEKPKPAPGDGPELDPFADPKK